MTKKLLENNKVEITTVYNCRFYFMPGHVR